MSASEDEGLSSEDVLTKRHRKEKKELQVLKGTHVVGVAGLLIMSLKTRLGCLMTPLHEWLRVPNGFSKFGMIDCCL